MTKKAILHITDLHISNDSKVSKLNTVDTENVRAFVSNFSAFVDKLYKDWELFLVLSGDVANAGEIAEFNFAKLFLEKLKIKKENVLVIPGNHDINWDENRKAHSKAVFENNGKLEGVRKAYEFQNEKFSNFKTFYHEFYESERTFDPEKFIIDKIVIKEEKLLILGLNSSYKCNYEFEKGVGYIGCEKLDEELKLLMEAYKDYVIIAVCHHNPLINYAENQKTGFEPANWPRVKVILLKYGINTILFGHEHTPSTDEQNVFYYLSIGSLSKEGVDNMFNVIEIENSQASLKLINKHFNLLDPKNKEWPDGYWTASPDSPFNKEIAFNVKPKLTEITAVPIFPEITTVASVQEQSIGNKENNKSQVANEFHSEIFKRVKDLKIFKTGHFHWSDTSRAHNWIDIPQLLNNKEDIFLIQKSIQKSIVENSIDFDLMIGLGIEGNIIAARCAANYDKPYTYLPYSYRYNDHADYEKKLKINTESYKRILIITDVVHDGKTIKKILIDEDDFFNKCHIEEINVVTLFFTGEEYSKDLLNDEGEKRFNFYYVSKVRVEECPYKKDLDWEKNCDIYCHKLDNVYEFYNKTEV